jgi:hypothetical protein
MSLVIYKDGVLGGDKRTITKPGEWTTTLGVSTKVHLHESNTFAIASCGDVLGPRTIKYVMGTIHQMVVAHAIADDQASITISKELSDQLFTEGRSEFILLLHDACWLLSKEHEVWVELTGTTYLMGNGAACASICLGAGLTVEQTLQETPFVNVDCGGGYDIVYQSQLTKQEFSKDA